MILNEHPGLQLLRESPWEAHLVGSRMVGPHDPRMADYDFLIVADSLYKGLYDWLTDNGFETVREHYGLDSRLMSTDVWRKEWSGWPPIDLLPVTPDECEFRLKFFRALQSIGDKAGGRICKALKAEKAWPFMWRALAALDGEKEE